MIQASVTSQLRSIEKQFGIEKSDCRFTASYKLVGGTAAKTGVLCKALFEYGYYQASSSIFQENTKRAREAYVTCGEAIHSLNHPFAKTEVKKTEVGLFCGKQTKIEVIEGPTATSWLQNSIAKREKTVLAGVAVCALVAYFSFSAFSKMDVVPIDKIDETPPSDPIALPEKVGVVPIDKIDKPPPSDPIALLEKVDAVPIFKINETAFKINEAAPSDPIALLEKTESVKRSISKSWSNFETCLICGAFSLSAYFDRENIGSNLTEFFKKFDKSEDLPTPKKKPTKEQQKNIDEIAAKQQQFQKQLDEELAEKLQKEEEEHLSEELAERLQYEESDW